MRVSASTRRRRQAARLAALRARWRALALVAGAALLVAAVVLLARAVTGGSAGPSRVAVTCGASTMSLSPAAGPVGTLITIEGAHWPAGTQVGIYLVDAARHKRPVELAQPGVLADGQWTLSTYLPASLPYASPVGASGPATFTLVPGGYVLYVDHPTTSAAGAAVSLCALRLTVQPGTAPAGGGAAAPAADAAGGTGSGSAGSFPLPFVALALLVGAALAWYVRERRAQFLR
jgi:hypothetical protein